MEGLDKDSIQLAVQKYNPRILHLRGRGREITDSNIVSNIVSFRSARAI